ncbi:unnamed protein product [Amoebophrya sp. A25]|nr:unnamed protein product [Amoebophrya sp. A25]|eukprot:GSA25T00005038001.1
MPAGDKNTKHLHGQHGRDWSKQLPIAVAINYQRRPSSSELRWAADLEDSAPVPMVNHQVLYLGKKLKIRNQRTASRIAADTDTRSTVSHHASRTNEKYVNSPSTRTSSSAASEGSRIVEVPSICHLPVDKMKNMLSRTSKTKLMLRVKTPLKMASETSLLLATFVFTNIP